MRLATQWVLNVRLRKLGIFSGVCFAEVGKDVLCLDVDPAKIKILEDMGIPIFGPLAFHHGCRARCVRRISATMIA